MRHGSVKCLHIGDDYPGRRVFHSKIMEQMGIGIEGRTPFSGKKRFLVRC